MFVENPSKGSQNTMTNNTADKKRYTGAIFCICCHDFEDWPFFRLKSKFFRNFVLVTPSILNIPTNFIFWYGTSKGHIQTKIAFPKNDNLNHNLFSDKVLLTEIIDLWVKRDVNSVSCFLGGKELIALLLRFCRINLGNKIFYCVINCTLWCRNSLLLRQTFILDISERLKVVRMKNRFFFVEFQRNFCRENAFKKKTFASMVE